MSIDQKTGLFEGPLQQTLVAGGGEVALASSTRCGARKSDGLSHCIRPEVEICKVPSALRKRSFSGYESFGREKLEFLQLPTSKRCEGSVETVADVYEHHLAFLGHANELWDGYLTNVSQAAVASIP